MTKFSGEIDPPARLLMGPGPVNAHPRVLRAMSAQLLGQFDPEFTTYMNETMALYRAVFQTDNRWTFLIDATARGAIEAALISLLVPGDRIVVGSIGRFGGLLAEIAERCGAELHLLTAPWGEVLPLEAIEDAVRTVRPRLFACVHGDTSTTMAQPIAGIGAICRKYGAFSYVDATATLGGMEVPVDTWGVDVVTSGLQKCLGGPSGSAPITISDHAAEWIASRRHIEQGLMLGSGGGNGPRIGSNYFDLAMIMDYWSEKRARECARLLLEETLAARFRRHDLASRAVVTGVTAMGLTPYGDLNHKMSNVTGIMIPPGIDGERVRAKMREDFSIEIGSSFGPLQGKIWRIGAMGWNATKPNVLTTLVALETVLRREGFAAPAGAAADAVLAAYP